MLTDVYSISGVPNGGYIAAIAVKAAKAAVSASEELEHGPFAKFADCLSVTGQFHAASEQLKPADIHTHIAHVGRSVVSVAVQVCQSGQPKVSFLVLLGNLHAMAGIQEQALVAPDLPSREDCVDARYGAEKETGRCCM